MEFTEERSGRVLNAASLRGKIVVVNFWADWCRPCIEELPLLSDVVEAAGADVVLVPAYYRERPAPGSKFHPWLNDQQSWFRDRVCWANDGFRGRFDLSSIPVTVVLDVNGEPVKIIRGSVVQDPSELIGAITAARKVALKPTP
jgi:thiol-disulfide isomerase/thioredoxin